MLKVYWLALHTAVTIVVHPHVHGTTGAEENVAFSILLLIGGYIWTRVISRSTAIATSLDRHNIYHQQTMDDLNVIGDFLGLPPALRRRLRAYFLMNREESLRKTFTNLTHRMSPRLQYDIAHELNRGWVMQVRHLRGCSRPMLTAVSQSLCSNFFSQMEPFGTVFALHLLTRGLVSRQVGRAYVTRKLSRQRCQLRVLTPGAVWGDDHLLLCNYKILEDVSAVAMTFCEVLILHRAVFEEILQEYPENHARMRQEYTRLVFIHGIRYYAAVLEEPDVLSELRTVTEFSPEIDVSKQRTEATLRAHENEEYQNAYRQRLQNQVDRACSNMNIPDMDHTQLRHYSSLAASQSRRTVSLRGMSAKGTTDMYMPELDTSEKRKTLKTTPAIEERPKFDELKLKRMSMAFSAQKAALLPLSGQCASGGQQDLRTRLAELEVQKSTFHKDFDEFRKSAIARSCKLEAQQGDLCEQVLSLGAGMRAMRETFGAQLADIIARIPQADKEVAVTTASDHGAREPAQLS